MAFITYVLLYGLLKGIASQSKVFSPEILIQAIWRCLLIQLIECGLIRVGLSTISVSIPFLDIFAYTGYKYVGLCFDVAARSLGNLITMLSVLYTAGMLAYFSLKTLAAIVPKDTTGPPRHLIILAAVALQFLITLFLNWL